MLTEDEAKTKWCPQSRVLSHTYAQDGKGRMWEGGYAWNRSPAIHGNPHDDADTKPYLPQSANCIGSACMMWRAEMERYTPPGGDPLATRKPTRPTDRGFCGLAGRPEWTAN